MIINKVLNQFKADEIGMKSAIATLKEAKCTRQEIKDFIKTAMECV